MKHARFLISVGSLLLLGGCQMLGGNNNSTSGGSQSSVLGKIRPKTDPELVAELKREQMMSQQNQQGDGGYQDNSSGSAQGRYLPNVSQDPFSAALSGATQSGDENMGNDTKAETVPNSKPSEANPFEGSGDSAPVEAATYGQYNGFGGGGVPAPPPGAVAGGLVPPPPAAVSLSTSANVAYGDPSANPYLNPYANPALNPYGIPMQFQAMPAQQGEQQRPAGLFGSGGKSDSKKSSSSEDDEEKDKKDNFVPIQPTGMPSRSQYKQRDDLKVLWNGAIATEQYQNLIDADGDLENRLKNVNVGLPPDSTKGIFSVTPRIVTSVFKPTDLGKKSTDKVQKMQQDLVQSYYRYLYEYNKFALAQQTVAARKQEVDVASSKAEKQRAAADLASAQNEADSAKEDLNTAQYELAANAGARAACSIIGKVSGVTPPVASLASAEKSVQSEVVKKKGGMLGAIGLGGLFGHKESSKEDSGAEEDESPPAKVKEVKEKPAKTAKLDKGDKSEKSKRKSKSEDSDDDLTPSSAPEKTKIASRTLPTPVAEKPSQASRSPISFDLKDIDITARKSILTVSVRNSGSDDFKISPDDISLAEGNKRISDASLRSEFDSLTVKPNEEVKGKITILGKPWNDRLTVNLSDGTTTVSLKRR